MSRPSEEGRRFAAFAVDRIKDNRVHGLLRELADAIHDEEDGEMLRRIGQSLKLLGDRARARGFDKTGRW